MEYILAPKELMHSREWGHHKYKKKYKNTKGKWVYVYRDSVTNKYSHGKKQYSPTVKSLGREKTLAEPLYFRDVPDRGGYRAISNAGPKSWTNRNTKGGLGQYSPEVKTFGYGPNQTITEPFAKMYGDNGELKLIFHKKLNNADSKWEISRKRINKKAYNTKIK